MASAARTVPEATSRPPRPARDDACRRSASPRAPASMMHNRMQAHDLTTAWREGVHGAGPRALTGVPTRLDSPQAAALLSCDLFRCAGIGPLTADEAAERRTAAAISPRSPLRG